MADFLDSNNISQAAFFVFRSACNDLKDLKVKLEFSDSDKSKLAKVKTEVEQLYGDSSIESKVNDALIEMRKPDYSPIDREKARQVIQKHFGERLNQLEKD